MSKGVELILAIKLPNGVWEIIASIPLSTSWAGYSLRLVKDRQLVNVTPTYPAVQDEDTTE